MENERKKAVFIGSAYNIARVYEGTAEKLAETLDFVEPVYDGGLPRSDADYIFTTWGMMPFSKEQIADRFPNLKAVFYAAGSVQSFAREFIASGVKVFSAWGANAVPVAQFTVAETLLALKGWFASVHRSGDTWKNHGAAGIYPGIMGGKVGIIGAGMIGKMVISSLSSSELRVEVLVYDKFTDGEAISKLGGRKATLEEIFSECDVISNHLANLPATVGMIGYELFSRMRPGAVFINTGRGAQVDADGMIRALSEDKSRIAVLDVTDPEEPPRAGSPLYAMENVFLTPHIAGSMGNEVRRMAEYMYDDFKRYEAGMPTMYEVTERMLDTMA